MFRNPKTRQVPGFDRRRFLQSLLGLIGGAVVAPSMIQAATVLPRSPIEQGYLRLRAAQAEVLRIVARINAVCNSLAYEDQVRIEKLLDDAVAREDREHGTLIDHLLKTTGTRPDWIDREYDEHPQEPIAVHREGSRLYVLAICCPGELGSFRPSKVSRSAIRVIVANVAGGVA